MTPSRPMVQLVNISKAFQHPSGPVEVLKNLSFSLGQGQSCSILGPSGSGKSTLLSILSGLERPDQGEIHMAGQGLNSLTEKDLTSFRAQCLGIVFQQFHLIPHLTALENVALALDISGGRNSVPKAEQALKEVGLSHRLRHYPSEMSGGECQRIAIARAMVTQPKILLADEPSGNLDKSTGEHVMQTLFERVKQTGTTLILVTHNEALAQACDHHRVMENGQLIEPTSL